MKKHMRILFFLSILIFVYKNGAAQNIGVTARYCDTVRPIYDIISTSKGSIYAVGSEYAAGDVQACIIKFDKDYNILWQKNMGGSAADKFLKIRQISENRLLIVGNTLSSDGDLAIYGYTQSTTGNIWVLVVDTAGNKIYGSEYGYGGYTIVTDATVSQDGNVYILGNTLASLGDFAGNGASSFLYNPFVIRTDTMLNKKWVKIFQGSDEESASGIIVNDKEQILISFGAASYDGDFTLHTIADGQSVAIIKCIDTAQNLIWEKKYGGTQGEQGYVLIPDSQTHDFYLIGAGWSKDGDMWDASPNLNNPEIANSILTWVMRLDSIGNKKWSKIYGPLGNNPSQFASCNMQENWGGGVMKNGQLWILNQISGRDDNEIGESMGGGDKSDLWLIVIDTANGNVRNRKRLGAQCEDIPKYIKGSMYNNDIYIGAWTSHCGTIDSPLNSFGCLLSNVSAGVSSYLSFTLGFWPNSIKEVIKKNEVLKIYPNPAKDVIIIERDGLNDATKKYKIKICNSEGKICYKSELLYNQNKLIIPTSQWNKGIYILEYEWNGIKQAEQISIY